MRLIDADAEIEKIKDEIQCIEQKIQNWEDNRADRSGKFDVDKKIKQLNDNILHARCEIRILNGYKTAYDVDKVLDYYETMEIVKGGGIDE